MNTPNTEKLGDLLSQLGGILGVGRRSDGKFYLADMCQASSINKWAIKPIPLKDSAGNDVTDNAYTKNRYYSNAYKGSPENRTGILGNVVGSYDTYYEIAGMDVPMIALNPDTTLDNQSSIIVNTIKNYSSNGKNWPKTPWSRRGGYKRIRDFDGYDHSAVCPFMWSINKDIPADATAATASMSFQNQSNAVPVQDIFSTIFNDDFYLAAVFVKNDSTSKVVVSNTKMSIGAGSVTIPTTLIAPFADIDCYFFAYNPTKMIAIPLPSESAYPNPISTSVSEYASVDPFPKLSQPYLASASFNDVFGYNTSTGITNMINLRDASPSGTMSGGFKYAPSTTGPLIFSATLTNVAANNASVVINPNNVRVIVTLNNNSSTKKILTPKVYGPTLALLTNNYTISAGGQMRFYFYLDDVWSGQSVIASDTTAQAVDLQLTYYSPIYANNSYPTSYPNMGSTFIFVVKPSTSSNNGKVATPKYSSGNTVGGFVTYESV